MTVDFGLADRVIVITGAGGIGAATATEASQRGATVALLDADEDALDRSSAAIVSAGGHAHCFTADVCNEPSVDKALAAVESSLGPIYGVVPSAGMTRPASADTMTIEDWNNVVDVNLTGTFLTTRLAARRMLPRGSGAMVFLSSIDGIGGHDGRANYAASKWGVIGMAKSMAIDWGRSGIRVNAVCPGPVDTPLFRGVTSQERIDKMFIPRIPLGRIAQPQDQAKAIVFLLSGYASCITGAVLPVDGGMSAGYLTDIPPS